MTISDPNCAYCGGTGASYLTAPDPLGPWTGAMRSDAPVVDGRLELTGRGALAKGGADWTDYTLELSVAPRQVNGRYAQSGWFFRAADERNGYAWLIGNYPHPGATGGNLTKVVYVDGQPRVSIVKLPFPIADGRTYRIRQELQGATIRTFIDGTLVDTTTDATYARGTIGLRETTGESGVLRRRPRHRARRHGALPGRLLRRPVASGRAWSRACAGSRSARTRAAASPPTPRACPAAAARSTSSRATAGTTATRTRRWPPTTGSRCASAPTARSSRCAAARASTCRWPARAGRRPRARGPRPDQRQRRLPRLRRHQPRNLWRAQTFTAGRTGTLTRLAYTGYQDNHPNGPLDARRSRELTEGGAPGTVLAQRSIPAGETRWAPSELVLDADVPVVAGRRYALVVSAPSSTVRRLRVWPTPTATRTRAATALVSSDGGAHLAEEAGRDLKFETSVQEAR